MKYPLVPISLIVCLGILIASYLEIPFIVFYLLASLSLAAGIIFIKHNETSNILVLCALFFLGAVLLKNSQTLPPSHIANLTPYKGEPVYLKGVITDDPVRRNRSVSFTLSVSEFKKHENWIGVCGKVLVRDYNKDIFSYGDKLLLEGRLFRPLSFSDEFDYRDYLKRQGIHSILSVKKGTLVKRLGSVPGNPLKSFAFRLRHRIKAVFSGNLSPFSAGVLNAVILGDRSNLSSDARDALVKSGSVHVIAISGLHVGIVAFITLAILKLTAVPRKARYALTIMILLVYCVLTGARTPVVRATIMAVILLLGFLLEREVNIYNSLALAAFLILAVNPRQLFEASFQLSFLSVISIVWLAPKIKALFPERLNKISWAHFTIMAFSVSAAAWLGLVPLIAYYFRIISPVTVLANMIIVPYISIIVASGLCLGLVGMPVPPLAPVLAASSELFILILFKINSFLIAIPGAYFTIPRISIGYILVYYVLLTLIFSVIARRPKAVSQ